MSYDNLFDNLAKAFKANPMDVGQPPDSKPKEVLVQSETLNVGRVGALAGRQSDRILDNKEHFPVATETQAQSSMVRVLQLKEAPAWYNGTLAELRKDVYDGIIVVHPNIQLNIRVPIEQTTALSDGTTKPETSKKSVKDPADVVKTQVPGVPRPSLTSAEFQALMANDAARKTLANGLVEMLDSQLVRIQSAKDLAIRLMDAGLTGEEFAKLEVYCQQEVLHGLMQSGVAASENRRRELLNRMQNNGQK